MTEKQDNQQEFYQVDVLNQAEYDPNYNQDPKQLENLSEDNDDNIQEKSENIDWDKSDDQNSDLQEKGNIWQEETKDHFLKSKSRSRSPQRVIKWCCDDCKKNDKNGKTCVCVVPRNQRKMKIGGEGCRRCGCQGCSKEDKEFREQQQRQNRQRNMRNGCCSDCMKAFSKSGRACLCQVPKRARKTRLPKSGCVICGCNGCYPEDLKKSYSRSSSRSSFKHRRNQTFFREQNYSRDFHNKRNSQNHQNYHNNRKNRNYSSSSSNKSYSNDSNRSYKMNFNNFDKSHLGSYISNQLNIYSPLIGFGIPQRTASYILGKPSSKSKR